MTIKLLAASAALLLMGAAPLGSLTAGIVSGTVGPLRTLQLFALGMMALVGLVWALTDTARLR